MAISPVMGPALFVRNLRFKNNKKLATRLNKERLDKASLINLPELEQFEFTALVEWKAAPGFVGDSGVSYLIQTEPRIILYDVGFGPTRPALAKNAAAKGFNLRQIDALVISHLYSDHMGGFAAQKERKVAVLDEMLDSCKKPCFLPDKALATSFEEIQAKEPQLLAAGIGSTGPLARSLFLFGFTEEQALVARLKNRGLVIITGCGHPTIQIIVDMVKRLSNEPIYAIGGGLHFPISEERGNRAGIQLQTVQQFQKRRR